jgi:hypothetical protein
MWGLPAAPLFRPVRRPDTEPPCQPLDLVDAVRPERAAALSCSFTGGNFPTVPLSDQQPNGGW